jgi:hypothetical protein
MDGKGGKSATGSVRLSGEKMNAGKKAAAQAACAAIVEIIQGVEIRCAATDGPVTPTRDEITASELKEIYRLAARGARQSRGGAE